MALMMLSLAGRTARVRIDDVIVAGWTGRDRDAVEAHIAELEGLGVARPSTTPVFYRVSASRLTSDAEIESTPASSGEAEALILRHEGRLWVGAGSDHTDRELEAYGVAVSKQLCDKPVAAEFWPYDEVAAHWDQLVLRSWIDRDVPYQDGALATLMHADALLGLVPLMASDRTLIFCGTLATIGPIRPAAVFRYQLEDPVLGRAIIGSYRMRELPLVR